jgi:Ca2+/Na+ antiporter
LYLAVSVTSALVGFVIRFIFLKKSFVGYSVKASFRQSFLFALLVVCSLLLLVNDLFNWWNMVLLILSLAVLEYFFICYELNSENGEEASTFTDDNINNEV